LAILQIRHFSAFKFRPSGHGSKRSDSKSTGHLGWGKKRIILQGLSTLEFLFIEGSDGRTEVAYFRKGFKHKTILDFRQCQ